MRKENPRVREAAAFFRRLLPAIRSVLATYYRLSEQEAREAEERLDAWFHRFARREGLEQVPVRALRHPLLSAACQYGRELQMAKAIEERSADQRLSLALAREPEEVAFEMETRLDAKK